MSILHLSMSSTPTRDFADGEVIFTEGAPPDGYMYALLEGQVDIFKNGHLLENIGPGGTFGELALLDNLPRSASAVSRGGCRIAAISADNLKEIVLRNPAVTLEIMRHLAKLVRKNMLPPQE